MAELALIIFGLIFIVTTKDLWKPFIKAKTADIELLAEEIELENQEKLNELKTGIVNSISKNGEWLTS
jgi:hypothetical protein